MGKKRKLNRFITKWIKSDLPEDHSTVLLLGVTRIPTSPTPARRPCSLPIGASPPFNPPPRSQFRPFCVTSSKSLSHRRRSTSSTSARSTSGAGARSTSTTTSAAGARSISEIRARTTSSGDTTPTPSSDSRSINSGDAKSFSSGDARYITSGDGKSITSGDLRTTSPANFTRQNFSFFTESEFAEKSRNLPPAGARKASHGSSSPGVEGSGSSESDSTSTTPSNLSPNDNSNKSSATVMDRSVDSIGSCSLNVDVSADLSDQSEGSSVGTLRSFGLPTPSPEQQRLPSYLSLACTVNGYSTTTNYDPERLARSRDASPHRLHNHDPEILTYSVHNNLLSPPNLVPLPIQRYSPKMNMQNKENMADHTITHHQQFYSSSKTVIYKESRNFSSSIISNDSVDACLENGHRNGIQSKCVTYSTKNMSMASNGQSKCVTESSVQEFTNGNENKSFIQQRVERLYGPGALAQGFFVTTKRQKNKVSESESEKPSMKNDRHSKSMNDKSFENDLSPVSMKQSTSSPALPVLRHLRPEFRAQLPIMCSKKGSENTMQKSSTTPTLKSDVKVNGHDVSSPSKNVQINGNKILDSSLTEKSTIKNGHYFMNIIDIEAKRLLEMAKEAEQELENTQNLPEEAKGYLRSAAGKAKLLVSQKMQQFKGLCTNNVTQVEGEAFPTTNEDLQGFWDMVMLQVDQIDALFKELSVLKANNWQEQLPEIKKVNIKVKKNNVPIRPASAGAEEARKQREVQRKAIIEARRKAMREQKQQQSQSIEIYVPESS